ncbi:MAG: N-acetylmuramoyl-L-alanine amidase, partial [Oscillospiraceae bacterium]|nr:N-acetylmuramoyl-L-alanine amidase [Oscillospiraceae bacterium]
MALFGLIAGHGGADPGATLGNRLEKNDNLKLCLSVGEMLKGRGHEVLYYREDDRACPAHLSKRWINETTADFFICFHRNAYNKKAFGAECWTFGDALSIKVGNSLISKISSAGGFYNRGRKAGGAACISSGKPSVQLETGFLDNASDNELFDANFFAITRAVCDCLDEHFERDKSSAKARTATALDWLNIRVA